MTFYGLWKVIGEAPSSRHGNKRVKAKCACGTERTVVLTALKQGKSKSCGCMKKEIIRAARTRHGGRYLSEYHTWSRMRQRCSNPKRPDYKYYGGRGIKVCREWEKSFQNFFKDMGYRPTIDHQLDRIDNNKGYSKNNCRWVKKIPQMQNTRMSKYWWVHGKRYESLSEAAAAHSVTISRIKAWCDGRSDGGYTYPPKENCWSEKKYADDDNL